MAAEHAVTDPDERLPVNRIAALSVTAAATCATLTAVAGGASAATTATAATLAAKTTVSAPAVSVQGVGVQLTDTQLINFPTNLRAPWQPEPDGYIGTKYQGTMPDPIAPGTSRTYHVLVSNTGNVTETMAVFPAAAAMSASGVFSYTSVSPASTDAASSWTTVTPTSAVLAPKASYTATVTVTVPAGTRAGSYYAVVWAGPQTQTAKPGSITLAIYTGIREYLTVS
jgi:hypothetical protein